MENRKPFDLQAAMRGEPVVARDGRKFKFGAYNPDARDDNKLLGWLNGLVNCWNPDGRIFAAGESASDLFMAHKKRTIWCRAFEMGNVCSVRSHWYEKDATLHYEGSLPAGAKWLDPEPWPHEVELDNH